LGGHKIEGGRERIGRKLLKRGRGKRIPTQKETVTNGLEFKTRLALEHA